MRQGLIKNGAAVKVRALYLLNTGLKAGDLMPGVAAVKPADSPARPGLASCTASPRRTRATPGRGAARAHPQARVLLFCDVKRRAAEPARGTVKQALGLTLAHRIGFGQFGVPARKSDQPSGVDRQHPPPKSVVGSGGRCDVHRGFFQAGLSAGGGAPNNWSVSLTHQAAACICSLQASAITSAPSTLFCQICQWQWQWQARSRDFA